VGGVKENLQRDVTLTTDKHEYVSTKGDAMRFQITLIVLLLSSNLSGCAVSTNAVPITQKIGQNFQIQKVTYRGRANGAPNKGDGLTNANYSTQTIRDELSGPLKNVFSSYHGAQKLELNIGCNAALPPRIIRIQLPAFGSFTCNYFARDIGTGKIVYGPLNVNAGSAFYMHHEPADMVRILSKLIVKEVQKTMLGQAGS